MVVTAVVGTVVGAGAGIGGAMIQSNAAQNAATTQANAATQNQNAIMAEGKIASGMDTGAIGTANAFLQPYQNLGTAASGLLQTDLQNGSLTKGFTPTQAALNAMPGYQFELQQGLEATQNGFAAKGLGSSGAAIKGAGQYAQGLASTDLNNLANIYYTNQANAYNRLSGATNIGLQAGTGMSQNTANLNMAGANALMGGATNAASLGMAGAAANAAGTIGSANALSNGLTGATNSASNGALTYALLAGSNSSNGNPLYGSTAAAAAYNANPLAINTSLGAPTFSGMYAGS